MKVLYYYFFNLLFSFFLGSLDLFSKDGKEIVIMILKRLWLSFFYCFWNLKLILIFIYCKLFQIQYHMINLVTCSSNFPYLIFLTSTEHGQPDQITTSLVPQRNSLVFFEVTPVSFHQVCKSNIACLQTYV